MERKSLSHCNRWWESCNWNSGWLKNAALWRYCPQTSSWIREAVVCCLCIRKHNMPWMKTQGILSKSSSGIVFIGLFSAPKGWKRIAILPLKKTMSKRLMIVEKASYFLISSFSVSSASLGLPQTSIRSLVNPDVGGSLGQHKHWNTHTGVSAIKTSPNRQPSFQIHWT